MIFEAVATRVSSGGSLAAHARLSERGGREGQPLQDFKIYATLAPFNFNREPTVTATVEPPIGAKRTFATRLS